MTFALKLAHWYATFGRDLPWRQTSDPYVIWLSEIILQQTRVEQGMPYFFRFLDAFPTVSHFAEADEADILRLWQGLGYYSRARNMHKAAKMVLEQYAGLFPTQYAEAIKLPGVGEYTAAAIASFSSNEAVAVVDGNVYRLLARYFGVKEAINSTPGKKVFAELAAQMLDREHPGLYNQAIMDFGALHCKPKKPLCESCVFRLDCVAYQSGLVEELPVKLKGKKSKDRYFHYILVRRGDELLMAKRGAGDVWMNLYEFPLIETAVAADVDVLRETADFREFFEDGAVLLPLGQPIKQVLSHQNIHAKFYLLGDVAQLKKKKKNWDYHYCEKIDTLAKHKLIFSFLEKNADLLGLG